MDMRLKEHNAMENESDGSGAPDELSSWSILPSFKLLMRGLGIQGVSQNTPEVTVHGPFLRFVIEEMARRAHFDPEYYASQYPEAAHAVAAGVAPSLKEYFVTRGYFEGHFPAAPKFDQKWYGSKYKDMQLLAERNGFAALQQHYETAGRHEGRPGSPAEAELERWGQKRHETYIAEMQRLRASSVHLTLTDHPVQARAKTSFGGPILGRSPTENRLRHFHSRNPVDYFDDSSKFEKKLSGEWNYLGLLVPHFGHAMAESFHRILSSQRRFQCRNWLVVGPRQNSPYGAAALPRFFLDAVSLFGIKSEQIFVLTQDSIVERLNIVEHESSLGMSPKPQYLDDLRDHMTTELAKRTSSAPAAERIYVSRSALPPGGTLLGERWLESVLIKSGFTIFHPENHSLVEQLQVYTGAQVVIFMEGSACHGAELLGTRMLNNCILIPRRSSHVDYFRNILKPRANSMSVFSGFFDIGTAASQSGRVTPAYHLSVSLIDPEGLRRFLSENYDIDLGYLNFDSYRVAAIDDLERYIRYYYERSEIFGEDLVKSIKNRAFEFFESARPYK